MPEAIRAPLIGVVICSSRRPRACPQIVDFVVDTIKSTSFKQLQSQHGVVPDLHIIDLQEWNLPMYDESDVPSQIHDYTKYDHEHTRRWSQEVTRHDAFIFVTPQYNWGYPAVLKNAIDYLYNEWKGKPAMIVTYGGHGGGRCAGQLRQVLNGIRMVPCNKHVELSFPGRDFMVEAARGKDLSLNGASATGTWAAERKQIAMAFGELIDLLGANKLQKMWKTGQIYLGLAKDNFKKKYAKETPNGTQQRSAQATET